MVAALQRTAIGNNICPVLRENAVIFKLASSLGEACLLICLIFLGHACHDFGAGYWRYWVSGYNNMIYISTLLRHPCPVYITLQLRTDAWRYLVRPPTSFICNTLALQFCITFIIGWYQNVVESVRNGDPLADTKEHSRPSKIWQSSEQVLLCNVDNTGNKNVYQFVKRI